MHCIYNTDYIHNIINYINIILQAHPYNNFYRHRRAYINFVSKLLGILLMIIV